MKPSECVSHVASCHHARALASPSDFNLAGRLEVVRDRAGTERRRSLPSLSSWCHSSTILSSTLLPVSIVCSLRTPSPRHLGSPPPPPPENRNRFVEGCHPSCWEILHTSFRPPARISVTDHRAIQAPRHLSEDPQVHQQRFHRGAQTARQPTQEPISDGALMALTPSSSPELSLSVGEDRPSFRGSGIPVQEQAEYHQGRRGSAPRYTFSTKARQDTGGSSPASGDCA